MIETIVTFLQDTNIPLVLIWLLAIIVTFSENIFPPSPSDTILIFMGSLISFGKVDFISLLLFSTLGSALGFWLMFYLGWAFGEKIIEKKKFSFLQKPALEKAENWFRKWGYIIIIINRFLSGTRAVISFFAGISKLHPTKTLIYASISSLIWNFILIYLGMTFGNNWQIADEYITDYGYYIMAGVITIILLYAFLCYWKQKKQK